MKDMILKVLTAKFEGVQPSILRRIAHKIAKTAQSPQEAQTIASEIDLSRLLSYYGDSRATEAARTALRNYRKEHECCYGSDDSVCTESKAPCPEDIPSTTGHHPRTSAQPSDGYCGASDASMALCSALMSMWEQGQQRRRAPHAPVRVVIARRTMPRAGANSTKADGMQTKRRAVQQPTEMATEIEELIWRMVCEKVLN